MTGVETPRKRIKPLETRYAGRRFRSRLEARYAVLFDHLGLRWDYEPEGYATPDGPYLPDFMLHLKHGSVLFEVKPENAKREDPRWSYASEGAGVRMIVAFGLPGELHLFDQTESRWMEWDDNYAFCVCPVCRTVGIEWNGDGSRICVECVYNPNIHGHNRTSTNPRITDAYRAALSARFEHGERG
jgi:hypothetical protein